VNRWPSSPSWLVELQCRFAELLRTPLDASGSALRAATENYDPLLLEATRSAVNAAPAARLAVYNRQYWFRLLTTLQRAFPLSARLLGFWHFNQYAARYLSSNPPQGWDIDAVGAGFADFLRRVLPATELELGGTRRVPSAALLEAAQIDAAYHAVFRAPPVNVYQPTAADSERLLRGRLCFSPAVALLTEHWPLCAMRPRALSSADETPLPLEARLAEPQCWLLGREQLRLRLWPLAPRQAELLELLRQDSVPNALARIEARCSPDERRELSRNVRQWLAQSVELGVWIGLDD
jgi:hypothetical protein